MRFFTIGAPALVVVAIFVAPSAASTQSSSLSKRGVSSGMRVETMSFGNAGIGDGDTTAIKRASQIVVPFGTSFALGERWSLDIAGAYTSGEIQYARGASGTTAKPALRGVSDLHLRATGRLLGDNLLFSLGANLPTGTTGLDQDQLSALRVLGAPALGFTLPSVGFGASGSVGLVGTRTVGDWIVALGASYEYRGKYSPIAALQAGAESQYDPGNTLHFSLGLERFVGDSRLSLQAGTDVYGEDKLLSGSAQTVRLGPVSSLDATLDVSGQRLRDARFFGSARVRSSFQRGDSTVKGSNGTYMNAGFEGGLPLGRTLDLRFGVDGRVQSGLDVDNTLMTAKTTSGGATLGLRMQNSSVSVDPFIRVVAGRIDSGFGPRSVTGMTFGLALRTRF